MWKRAILFTLCFLLACCPVAYAAQQRSTNIQPTLTFSGRTATCECKVSDPGKRISVSMELWDGSTLIDSWSANGLSTILLNETCTVTRGRTYTLTVRCTIDGTSISPTSITKKCPLIS